MFELIFLGTSASTPSVHRGLSAHLLIYRQYRFLIDCGEGTQRQILQSGLGFKNLTRILITHSHLDHILGLGGLISTLGRWETLEKVEIFAGRAALERIADLLFRVVWRDARPPMHIELITLQPGMTLVEDDKFMVTTFPVSHRGPDCFGFIFQEKPRRPFLAEKADALGVPFGPERGRLVQGQAITLADGRVIRPDDLLGDTIPGLKYVHIGDTGRTDNLLTPCQQANVLTIEATYTNDEADLAREFGHLTATKAAQLAHQANVQNLLLTHISRRHTGRDIRHEATPIFPNTYVARDFDHFQITQNGLSRQPNRETMGQLSSEK